MGAGGMSLMTRPIESVSKGRICRGATKPVAIWQVRGTSAALKRGAASPDSPDPEIDAWSSGLVGVCSSTAETGRAPRVRSGNRALWPTSSRHQQPVATVPNPRSPGTATFDSTGRLTDDLVADAGSRRRPMELFAKLFNSFLVFVYHC